MFSTFAGSRRLYLILAVWCLVCGLAAVDLYDLSDELLQPFTVAGVVVEPEIEELDEDSLFLLQRVMDSRCSEAARCSAQGWAVMPEPREQRAFPPLYLQAAQYRI